MLKAVIFDVDGVLIDSLEANHKFFADLLGKFGHAFMNKEEYTPLFHLPMKDIIRHSTKSTDENEIEKIWKSGRGREVPYPHELVVEQKHAKEVINNLEKDYTLGIVTSRTKDNIFIVPALEEIRGSFKVVVGYEDVENHKPHPEPLLLAARELNFLPTECVYIGDQESDILAAKAAGMKAIIYNKEKLYGADANFTSFEELSGIIELM